MKKVEFKKWSSGWQGRTGWSERVAGSERLVGAGEQRGGWRSPPRLFVLLKFGQLGFGQLRFGHIRKTIFFSRIFFGQKHFGHLRFGHSRVPPILLKFGEDMCYQTQMPFIFVIFFQTQGNVFEQRLSKIKNPATIGDSIASIFCYLSIFSYSTLYIYIDF